jgi:hypothetical protein
MVLAAATISNPNDLALAGAACFGVAVGYITYRTLVRTTDKASITDLATVIGAVGGGTVTTVYGSSDGSLFGMYGIGLVAGMLLYLLASLILRGKETTGITLGSHRARGD